MNLLADLDPTTRHRLEVDVRDQRRWGQDDGQIADRLRRREGALRDRSRDEVIAAVSGIPRTTPALSR